MASSTLRTNKAGKQFYQIAVSRGYGLTPYTTRWYIPDGWSKRSIDAGLRRAMGEFEAKCAAGEVEIRSQKVEREQKERMEAAKIQTVKEYGERVFMPMKRRNTAEKTRDYYQGMLNRCIYPAMGDTPLPEVNAAMITALLIEQQEKGDSWSTVNGVYVTVNQLFSSAYLADMIDRNPMDKVQRPRKNKDSTECKEVKFFNENELIYILECLASESLKWNAFFRLLIDAGCRRGEALGLRWCDVDFKENAVTIQHNLGYTTEKGIYLGTPKSGRKRTIYIDPEVMGLLRQIKNEQKLFDIRSAQDGFVFTQDGSTDPMHPDSPNRFCKRFSKKYGIDDFHPHKLRHSFASISITNGADIASVSEKLGHADKSTTLKLYTHADAESQKRASEVFRNAIKSKAAREA